MPTEKIATKFGAVGEGDILFVEDWGYTPELWVVEKISPAGIYGFRIQCAVITPDTFESWAIGTRDVLQATVDARRLQSSPQWITYGRHTEGAAFRQVDAAVFAPDTPE